MESTNKEGLLKKIKDMYGENPDNFDFVDGWIRGYCEALGNLDLQDYLINYHENYYYELSE